MRSIHLRYNPETFWKNYWEEMSVDEPQFINLEMYPIYPTRKYLEKNKRILECGFGAGRMIRHIHNLKMGNVFGLEYDLGACKKVKAAQNDLKILSGDILSLPFKENTFDQIQCFGVLSGLENNFKPALEGLTKVLKPGGELIVSLMIDNLSRRLQWLLSQVNFGESNQFYAYADKLEGWENTLESHGLEHIESTYMLSRYNLYHWTPFLREKPAADPNRARVDDREYRLNALGESLHQVLTKFLPGSVAGAALFVCRKIKTAE